MQKEIIDNLMVQIGSLTVNELLTLTETLKEKYSLDLSTFSYNMGDVAPIDVKKSYKISVEGIGDNKIAVIKAVREVKGLGLKESKDFVETIVGQTETFDNEIEAQDVFNMYQKIGLKVVMTEA